MHFQRSLIYSLLLVLLTASTNASNQLKKDLKEPNAKLDSVRIATKRSSVVNDNSFMPVFLTSSNVKADDFTQEMLKSLATNNYIKPSVKLSTSKSTNVSAKQAKPANKPINRQSTIKKLDKPIKSETVVTRWSKASTTNNFSPALPINLSKMHFDTTGFIPIVPKQSTNRQSSNAKLIKQASKPINRPLVNAKTVPLPAKLTKLTAVRTESSNKNSSKRKTLVDLNKPKDYVLPNPQVRTLKPIKTTIVASSSKPKSTSSKNNAKVVDNRSIVAAASSTSELNSYLASHLNSHDARKALLKMNTLRYLAKLSPQWAASSLSETYQSGSSPLKAYPIGKITVPDQGSSYEGGSQKKPEISIELIKEILHKLTNDEVQFNKLYVMGTHRQKANNDQQYDQPNQDDQGYSSGYSQGEQPQGGYSQDQNSNAYQEGGYNNGQDQGSYGPQEQGSYNNADNGGYSQPDYSQGGNYENGDVGSYNGDNNSNGDSYESGNSNGYNSNDGYNNQADNGNSYQGNGGNTEEGAYHLQSLDMTDYTNRAYVPAYSLNSLASFVHSRFKEIAMKKQMGEYQFTDNPYLNNYENYKSMDINYAQFVPDEGNNMMGGRKKKCSKNRQKEQQQGGGNYETMNMGAMSYNEGNSNGYNQQDQPSYNNQPNQASYNQPNNGGYANNDVNFDDSYNNYGMPNMKPLVFYGH